MARAETLAHTKPLIKVFPVTILVKEAYSASGSSVIVNRSSQFYMFSTDNGVGNIYT